MRTFHRSLDPRTVALTVAAAAFLAAAPASAQQNLGKDDISWHWDGTVPSGGWLRLYNVNGAVHITASSDASAHLAAVKRVHNGGDPHVVHFAVVRDGNDVIVCALWRDDATCGPNGSQGNNVNNDWNDHRQNVSVDFDMHVPNGVRTAGNTVNGGLTVERVTSDVVVHTVNGEVQVRDVGAAVRAATVNGDVRVDTRGGPVSAETVNGSVHATMGSQGSGNADMRFRSVNGTIEITAPSSLNADVELSTVNGSIDSRFPLNYDRRHRHADGKVGNGGPDLRATTVNGSVRLN